MRKACKVTVSEDQFGTVITYVKWINGKEPVVYSFKTKNPIGDEICPALYKMCNIYLPREV